MLCFLRGALFWWLPTCHKMLSCLAGLWFECSPQDHYMAATWSWPVYFFAQVWPFTLLTPVLPILLHRMAERNEMFNAADAGLQGEGPQEVVLSWDIICFPCLWCSCSCTSPAPSGMITTRLAWTDLWVSDSLSFCSSLPCWSPSEWRHNCVSICPIENSQNDVYSMCRHAVRPCVAVTSGNFKGSVLKTLLWLDSCFYCYSDEIMPSHE